MARCRAGELLLAMGERLVVLGRERMKNISSAWIAKKAKQIQPAIFDRPVPTDCVA